ncbi:MAG: anthranilate phosphoribosyltransferase [Parvularculaceae bacterium]
MSALFSPYLKKAVSGDPLTRAEMRAAITLLLEGAASPVETAGFLIALRARGETVEEIAAAAEAMREKALKVDAPEDAVDTCGTGGDGAGTFNISTASALIAAGAGARVAKHGNKAATSKSGSSEVLAALGVKLDIPPAQITACIREANVGFMFAALHHGAVANVAPVRRELGVRTLFNLLGPLSNPAGARRQVVGVFAEDLAAPMAEALKRLGAESAWVVHGSDGLDELTTTGPSFVAKVWDGAVRTFSVTPEDAGLPRAQPEDLKGGGPEQNAAAIRRLLDGEAGPFRDIAVLNAAAALIVAGKAADLKEGAALAAAAIDDGRAKAALDKLVERSNAGA